MIPINSLTRHVAPLRERLLAVAAEVIDSGHYVLGSGVCEFEQAFAAYCGAGHCVGVGNGTDALELALKGVGLRPGEAVAVTANAGMYATSAVHACEGEPVFVDVLDDAATLDPAALAQVLDAAAIQAVVVTHLYGRLARMVEIEALCRARGIPLVEDCAQAHGARDADGRCAGGFGNAAAFSFYPTKNLGALGDGGAVVTSDDGVAARVRSLRQYGWRAKYENVLSGGRNSRLDEMQARMLVEMLPLLDGWNARRRAIAQRYSAGIRHPSIGVPAITAGDVVHLYVVRCGRRDALAAHLASRGIASDVHYPVPDHRQPCHDGRHDSVSLPVTEQLAATALTLPCFPELLDDEVDMVIEACNRF